MESPIAFYRAAFLAVLPRYTGLGHKAAITSADELARLATVHVFGEGAIEREEQRQQLEQSNDRGTVQQSHSDVAALMAEERRRAHDKLVEQAIARLKTSPQIESEAVIPQVESEAAIVSDGVSKWSAGEEYRVNHSFLSSKSAADRSYRDPARISEP